MKRLIFSIISVILILGSLVGCEGLLGGEQNSGIGGSGGNNDNGGELSFTRLVVASSDIDTNEVRSKLIAMGKMLGTVGADEAAIDGEIVFGDTDRAVTLEAKAKLAELIAADPTSDTGYIIYCNGKNLAVYWASEYAAVPAMLDFVKTCIDDMRLQISGSVISHELYLNSDLKSESQWMALEAKCDPDVYAALRSLGRYYDKEKMMGWFANLWDSEIGGFYYSISARDNEPFLPDIESTNQAIGWLQNNGFISDWNRDVPDDIKILLVDFARSLQSSTDGYFYHPQWPKGRENLNVDRYSRDLSWATSIITRFKIDRDGDGIAEQQYPIYCAPEGTKCKEHAENGGICSLVSSVSANGAFSSVITAAPTAMTVSLCSGVGAAVSTLQSSSVSAAALSDAHPDYSSASAFRAWLERTNSGMGESSGNAQNINALQDTIISNGYCTTLLDFLDEKQEQVYQMSLKMDETPTGLWTYNFDYNAVWGLLKYTPFYNDKVYGRELKYAEEIVRACIKVIMLPADKNYKLNDVYNQWQGMQALFNNVEEYAPEKLDSLYKIVRESGAQLIANTEAKLADFKCDDGAFSFYTTRKSSVTMYGTQIAMGVEESDVNASVLACSTYRCAFSCFGYDVIKLASAEDGEKFMRMLREVEPIEKNPRPPVTTVEFDPDYAFAGVKHDNMSGSSTLTVVEDDTLEDNNYVLKYNSYASSGSFGDGVQFGIEGSATMNSTITECNMKIVSSLGNNDVMQIRLGDFYRLRINRSGNTLKIYEMLEKSGDVEAQNITDKMNKTLNVGEWFKIRIEAYRTDEDYNTPRFKIFIDDQFVTETSGAYGANSVINESCTTVLFRSYKSTESEVHFDNCFFYGQYKDYDPGETEIYDDRNN